MKIFYASLLERAPDKRAHKDNQLITNKHISANADPAQTQAHSHLRPADEGHLYARTVTGLTMWADDFYRSYTWSATVFIGY